MDEFVRNKIFIAAVLSVLLSAPYRAGAEADASSSTVVEISTQTTPPVSEPPQVVVPADTVVIQSGPENLLPAPEPAAAAASAAGARPLPRTPVKRDLNVGVNYPGAALRYFVADGKALELLGQYQEHIFVGGLRYYYYPAPFQQGGLCPYLAAEGDFTSFKGSYAKGTGWGGGLFAGAEYFLGRRVSVQTDLGALYLAIKDKDTALGESGLEFIINLGFNIYLTRSKP